MGSRPGIDNHAGCTAATTTFLGEHFTAVIGSPASTVPSPAT
jgi:hypothetical protein